MVWHYIDHFADPLYQDAMSKKEIDIFSEVISWMGDVWTPEQVEDAYDQMTLEEALQDSMQHLLDRHTLSLR